MKKYAVNSNNYQTALEKYNKAVSNNLDNIESNEYNDPDKISQYFCEINNLKIYLSQDGLCGYKAIIKHSDDIESDYRLLRENMFDCLVWPAYAMSINQMRYSKFKDRLDLLLIDIQKFYTIINKQKQLTPEIISQIMDYCEIGRAYIFPHTFYWLQSFNSFDEFISKRNFEAFIDLDTNNNFIAQNWIGNDNNTFNQEYYKELLHRVKKYKKINI